MNHFDLSQKVIVNVNHIKNKYSSTSSAFLVVPDKTSCQYKLTFATAFLKYISLQFTMNIVVGKAQINAIIIAICKITLQI